MKRRLLSGVLSAGVGLLVSAATANAQTLGPGIGQNNGLTRPAVSAYMNLMQPGNTAVNYNNTRTAIGNARQFQNLQQQIQQQPGTVAQLGMPVEEAEETIVSGYAVTGHPSNFFNYSHYFPVPGPMTGRSGLQLGIGRRY